jgi:hypothetical protein
MGFVLTADKLGASLPTAQPDDVHAGGDAVDPLVDVGIRVSDQRTSTTSSQLAPGPR